MRLSEAHADISVHLMTLNPGPGHGGMSCTSPSKSTFSMAWHHNRNAKNAQSPGENSNLSGDTTPNSFQPGVRKVQPHLTHPSNSPPLPHRSHSIRCRHSSPPFP